MNERLVGLTSADVKMKLTRIEPQTSYSDRISQQLQETVFGQEEATKAVARRLALFDTGLGDPHRPLGSMFFLGPSGVGKTEMARAAQKVMGLADDRLKIINMEGYQESHYAAKFFGSPPGYVGYAEEPAIPHDWLHKGRSIVVFDEIDKAHPAIRQALLGVLDKGTMDARAGQQGNKPLHFNNSLLIFTSNIAGGEIHAIMQGKQGIGFHGEVPTAQQKTRRIQAEAQKGLEHALSPEFINRLDDIVVFNELTDPNIYDRMVTKFIDERNQMLTEQRKEDAPYFAVTAEFRKAMLAKSQGQGGRALRRLMERELFDKAADVFMGIDVRRRPLVADYEDGGVVFYTDVVEEAKPIVEIVPAVEVKKKQSPVTPIPTAGEDPLPGVGSGKEAEEGGTGNDGDSPEPTPSEKDTGDEDIKGPKEVKVITRKGPSFFIPMAPWATIDLAITVHQPHQEDMHQVIDNLPLV